MSVDALQNIFQRIEGRVATLIERNASDTDIGHCLARAWNDNFHTDLSEPAVKGMVMHYRAVLALPAASGDNKDKSKGRHTKRNAKVRRLQSRKAQRGGMAPLGWTLGQGITAPVYGRFPTDYSNDATVLGSMNRYYESSIGRSCNSVAGHDAPGQGQGKGQGQYGGGFLDSLFMPHAPASVPRNSIENIISHGQIANPPVSPVSYHAHITTPTLRPYDPAGLTELTKLPSVYKGY